REELDLTHLELVCVRLRELRPDYVVHGAAYTAVDNAETEPALADRINHLATREIAKYCNQHRKKLIYISTDYVFSGENNVLLNEDATVDPINIYGKTKLLGELAALQENKEAVILRTSWVYSRYGKNFVKTMCRLMREREY